MVDLSVIPLNAIVCCLGLNRQTVIERDVVAGKTDESALSFSYAYTASMFLMSSLLGLTWSMHTFAALFTNPLWFAGLQCVNFLYYYSCVYQPYADLDPNSETDSVNSLTFQTYQKATCAQKKQQAQTRFAFAFLGFPGLDQLFTSMRDGLHNTLHGSMEFSFTKRDAKATRFSLRSIVDYIKAQFTISAMFVHVYNIYVLAVRVVRRVIGVFDLVASVVHFLGIGEFVPVLLKYASSISLHLFVGTHLYWIVSTGVVTISSGIVAGLGVLCLLNYYLLLSPDASARLNDITLASDFARPLVIGDLFVRIQSFIQALSLVSHRVGRLMTHFIAYCLNGRYHDSKLASFANSLAAVVAWVVAAVALRTMNTKQIQKHKIYNEINEVWRYHLAPELQKWYMLLSKILVNWQVTQQDHGERRIKQFRIKPDGKSLTEERWQEHLNEFIEMPKVLLYADAPVPPVDESKRGTMDYHQVNYDKTPFDAGIDRDVVEGGPMLSGFDPKHRFVGYYYNNSQSFTKCDPDAADDTNAAQLVDDPLRWNRTAYRAQTVTRSWGGWRSLFGSSSRSQKDIKQEAKVFDFFAHNVDVDKLANAIKGSVDLANNNSLDRIFGTVTHSTRGWRSLLGYFLHSQKDAKPTTELDSSGSFKKIAGSKALQTFATPGVRDGWSKGLVEYVNGHIERAKAENPDARATITSIYEDYLNKTCTLIDKQSAYTEAGDKERITELVVKSIYHLLKHVDKCTAAVCGALQECVKDFVVTAEWDFGLSALQNGYQSAHREKLIMDAQEVSAIFANPFSNIPGMSTLENSKEIMADPSKINTFNPDRPISSLFDAPTDAEFGSIFHPGYYLLLRCLPSDANQGLSTENRHKDNIANAICGNGNTLGELSLLEKSEIGLAQIMLTALNTQSLRDSHPTGYHLKDAFVDKSTRNPVLPLDYFVADAKSKKSIIFNEWTAYLRANGFLCEQGDKSEGLYESQVNEKLYKLVDKQVNVLQSPIALQAIMQCDAFAELVKKEAKMDDWLPTLERGYSCSELLDMVCGWLSRITVSTENNYDIPKEVLEEYRSTFMAQNPRPTLDDASDFLISVKEHMDDWLPTMVASFLKNPAGESALNSKLVEKLRNSDLDYHTLCETLREPYEKIQKGIDCFDKIKTEEAFKQHVDEFIEKRVFKDRRAADSFYTQMKNLIKDSVFVDMDEAYHFLRTEDLLIKPGVYESNHATLVDFMTLALGDVELEKIIKPESGNVYYDVSDHLKPYLSERHLNRFTMGVIRDCHKQCRYPKVVYAGESFAEVIDASCKRFYNQVMLPIVLTLFLDEGIIYRGADPEDAQQDVVYSDLETLRNARNNRALAGKEHSTQNGRMKWTTRFANMCYSLFSRVRAAAFVCKVLFKEVLDTAVSLAVGGVRLALSLVITVFCLPYGIYKHNYVPRFLRFLVDVLATVVRLFVLNPLYGTWRAIFVHRYPSRFIQFLGNTFVIKPLGLFLAGLSELSNRLRAVITGRQAIPSEKGGSNPVLSSSIKDESNAKPNRVEDTKRTLLDYVALGGCSIS